MPVPENPVPENRVPENRVPENRVPENTDPENRRVGGRRAWTLAGALAIVVSAARVGPAEESPAAASWEDFYRPDIVQAIHLRVAEADWDRMLAALPERIYVPASFRWRDTTIDRVAVRFKGNSSSSPHQRHKRSFLIKFNEYDGAQRFLGMRRVSLDNGIQFGSLFSEPIVTEILRDLGIKTHRCNYAKLYLNGERHGVYGNVERIDESFVERSLGGGKGPLFKVDLGGPGGNLEFIGDEPAAYQRAFEPKNKSAEKGHRQLVDLIRMIRAAPAEEFAARLDAQLELDDFLQTTAVMLFSGAFDQLTGWNPHNYYLWRDVERDRWRYLPWDLDVGFCEVAFGKIRVLDDWNAAWPLAGGRPNPLLERILDDPELLRRYRLAAREILEKHFEPERLCARFDAKYALIKEHLARDPFPHQRVTNPGDHDYGAIVESMKEFVRKRHRSARQQLDNPGERPPAPRRPRSEEPRPGPASKDAPTLLRVVSNAPAVVLQWTDNAEGEAGHILQRAEGDGEFKNYLGQPGAAVTEATDRRAAPGKTYRYRVYAITPTQSGPRGTGVSNVVTVEVPAAPRPKK